MITEDTNANEEFDKQDTTTLDIPQGADTVDNSYATSAAEPFPVIKDEERVEQPNDERDPDSDEALEQDEAEAINQSNILQGNRLRHAKPRGGGYKEPTMDEGLPGPEEGTSGVRSKGTEGAYENKPGGSRRGRR